MRGGGWAICTANGGVTVCAVANIDNNHSECHTAGSAFLAAPSAERTII